MARVIAERANAIAGLAEIFREYGYEGASLSLITRATGLGKGSLYHFFPGGKAEMLAAVLADIDAWFEVGLFIPLEREGDAAVALTAMFETVSAYFQSGRRICLVGVVGLGTLRDDFAKPVASYFSRWIEALAGALRRGGVAAPQARELGENAVAGIQGAIVLSRALNDPEVFVRVLMQLRARLLAALNRH
jgi:TetR/AcrR family transcriptional regulator, lmrAB and yxaGH operons repressor